MTPIFTVLAEPDEEVAVDPEPEPVLREPARGDDQGGGGESDDEPGGARAHDHGRSFVVRRDPAADGRNGPTMAYAPEPVRSALDLVGM